MDRERGSKADEAGKEGKVFAGSLIGGFYEQSD